MMQIPLVAAALVAAIYPKPRSFETLDGSVDAALVRCESRRVENIRPQGYRLEITPSGKAIVEYGDEDGLFYANDTLAALKAEAAGGKVKCVRIEDYPSIAVRGVVEGYYGRPWGYEGRVSLIKFMRSVKMNTFIYGPKDDPYHHSKWRQSYPVKQKEEFRKLLAVAAECNVDFHWAIHLGGNFAKKGEERAGDYVKLFAKLSEMYDLGVRSFAVFFDDFGDSNAAAHAEICNKVVGEFINAKPGCTRLVVCPRIYWGLGSKYIRTLGEKLDPSVDIMWTGERVCRDIPVSDVEKITEAQGRAPYLWWNWPVNDFCRKKVLMGRTYGLSGTKLSGFVTNPMENCEANKVAIFGCADWAWNPEGFDSHANWDAAFPFIYGDGEIARAMKVFARHNSDPDRNGWGFRREESVGAEKEEPSVLFEEIRDAMKVLESRLGEADKALWFELEGWVRCQRALAEIALEALKGDKADINAVAGWRKAYREAQDAHVEKFAAATFGGDRGRVKKPEPSTLVIVPLVDSLVEKAFAARWEAKTSRKYVRAEGLEGFSTSKSFPSPVAARDFKYAGFGPVFEPVTLAPGEVIGVKIPGEWKATHVQVEISDAAGLVLEISADGKEWEELKGLKKNGRSRISLRKKAGSVYFARLRNASGKNCVFKLERLEFFVEGDYSPIDLFVSELM